jgi:hypothetical protein
MDFVTKKDTAGMSDEDQILKFSIIYLGLKSKIKEEAKVRTEENK